MIDLNWVRGEAAKLILEAGARVAHASASPVHEKGGHYNFVTEMDVATQEFLREGLMRLIPDACFFAEEQENNVLTDAYTWVVDPIDGTTNFIRGRHASSISIALLKDREPVVALICQPYLNELYTAVKGQGAFLNDQPIHVSALPFENALADIGTSPYYAELWEATAYCFHQFLCHGGDIRRVGSAAIDCCDIACGRAEIFCEMRLSPWDIAAGALLIREAGGCFMMPFEDKVDFSKTTCILATNPVCREAALNIVKQAKELIKA